MATATNPPVSSTVPAAMKLQPGPERSRWTNRFDVALLLTLVLYLFAWSFTGAHFMADTNIYRQAILRHEYGRAAVNYRLSTSNPFWDFGHLLWRPFGWLCFETSKPITRAVTHNNVQAEVVSTLIGINAVAGLVSVALFFLLARRVIGKDQPAALATIGFFSADAFLNYTHSGNAYVVGLAFLVAGIYCSFSEDGYETVCAGYTLAAGLMFALSVLYWFPYVFVMPAALAAPLVLRGNDAQRRRRLWQMLAVSATLGLVAYGVGIAAAGIRNLTDLQAWVLAASHGQIQPGGVRSLARFAFALPRSFINMDQDGMWLKRFLLHDPYASVTAVDLLRLSLWKLALFYTVAAFVCLELWRTRQKQLVLLLAAVLPICFFAIFIFESGSIERYLPLYPFMFLAFGYALATSKRFSRVLFISALAVIVVVNLHAMSKATLDSKKALVESRIHDLLPLLKPNDLVLAVNEQDNLAEFRQDFPLDPINANRDWQTYDVLEINTARLATWREDFAKRVLACWQRGGAVWLPKRFVYPRPNPEWNWVEGDDKRVKWTDLPAFFSQLELGASVGGADGFVFLVASPKNSGLLIPLSEALGMQEPKVMDPLTSVIFNKLSDHEHRRGPMEENSAAVVR